MRRVMMLMMALLLWTGANAQSGGGYDLSWWTIDGGGITFATGGSFNLGGTVGQPDASNPLTGGQLQPHGRLLVGFTLPALPQGKSEPQTQDSPPDISEKLKGFDEYMEKLLKDWNAPGIGVGIVVGDKLVFAKGYGYRDYEKKLPFTPTTLFPIASNTKLFTAVAAGLLVEEGKLTWDKPIRDAVPSIRFYNDTLNNMVTLRDMLAHRTGVTRHDMIWYRSDFSRKELFERLKYLEPKEPMRQTSLYNNLMYAAVGYIIELQTGKTWETFVSERILKPLNMNSTVFTVADMLKHSDVGVPFTEKRDTMELYKIPYYEETEGVAPAGAIISNIEEMSHWLIALMNEGKYAGVQVLPPSVLKATLEPAIALPNAAGEALGFWEQINTAVGMGRMIASYRGHFLTFHGGAIDGFYSQVSFMPQERIGVIVFVIGDHCAPLVDIITYNVYERLLGLSETPWSERLLALRLKNKQAGKEARAKAGADRVPNTNPSHPLADYVGDYEHPAYGVLKIGLKDGQLQFDFRKIQLPLSHFHYDRFDTPDDERFGRWSVNFLTNPQGDIDKAVMSLDEAEATFTRKPEALDLAVLQRLAGTYETPAGVKFQVVLKGDGNLYLQQYRVLSEQPDAKLIHYKGLTFRVAEFSDVVFEFVEENGQIKALKQRSPAGEVLHLRIGSEGASQNIHFEGTGQDKKQDIKIGEKFSFRSKILNEERSYWVYLPDSYNNTLYMPQRYPVLYLLDGDAHFHSASGVVQFMSTGINGNIQIPELIIVAIPNTDRTRDLTPTHSEISLDGKEHAFLKTSGGGDKFLQFMREELFPQIESRYRTLPYRILVGHSSGGLLALHAFLNSPEMFNAYIAIDPSLWWDNQVLVRQAERRLKEVPKRRASVYISLANTPNVGGVSSKPHENAVRRFAQRLKSAAPSGVRSTLQFFKAEDHGSVPLLSLYYGLLYIFDGYRPSWQQIFEQPAEALNAHFKRISERLGLNLLPPEAFVNGIGYVMLYQYNDVEKAIDFFKLNVRNYPDSWNVYDSLAEAYQVKGDKSLAIENYEKSLKLNPSNQNAVKRLQALKGSQEPK